MAGFYFYANFTGFFYNVCALKNEMNITFNGNSVNGYPIKVKNAISIPVMEKFIDCTNRVCNVESGGLLTTTTFDYNYIWSHCFEAEEATQGWVGVDFKLNNAFTTEMTMVAWVISNVGISVDKFHSVQKISL